MPIKNEDDVSRRTRDLYERALSAIDRKSYSMAIDFLLEAIALEPEFLQAHKLLRATQTKHFGATGTAALFKKGLAMLTTMPGLGMGLAQLTHKPREAMITAYKMLNQDPTNTQGLDLLIRAAQKMELPEIAVLAAEAAVTASPRNITFLGTLAELYRAADQAQKAQDVYERMLELRPNDPDILHAMKDVSTLVHMSETKIETAQSYRELIKDSKEAVSLEQEAKVVRSEEMINQLIEDALKQIEAQPDNLSLLRKLADLYQQKGDFDNAQKALEKAVEREGGDAALQKSLGDLKLRRVDSKIKVVKSVLDQRPNDPALLKEMEQLHTQHDQLQLEEAERRVRSYPNDLGFRFELGSLYFRANRTTDALQEFQQAQRSPQHRIKSLNYLGLCFRDQKMFDLAVKQFQTAEKEAVLMDNTKKEVIYHLGETFELMGKAADAGQQYLKIYEVDINFLDVSAKVRALQQS